MRFEQSFIEELKSRNEIVDVISAYCQLERKGGAYWARCPLPGHMEKTPSFCVNQAGQFFKCFGCGRGGDVISFIMEVESLSYTEAVKFLADRAGMELPETDYKDEIRASKAAHDKEVKLAILRETALFYVHNLKTEKGKAYVDYVLKRGFDRGVFKMFGIGASLDYRTLPRYLARKGFKYDDMVAAGVVTFNKEKNEYYDFEAERLIIPIIDNMNNVIAFGGRVIVKTDFAKYKNTRETTVFIKNKTLYNINNLKKLKREKGVLPYVIMVEGYMDVIALYSAGFKNVVASMGTSLTVEQARLLLRYTDTVVISYDGDSAGQNATFRGLQILKDAGLTVKCVSLPDNLDPDEIIKLRGAAAYQKLVDEALPLIDYKIEFLRKKFDLTSIIGKRQFVDNALRVIRESDREFEREELLKKLSEMSRLTYESLKRDLEKAPLTESKREEKIEEKRAAPSGGVKAERFILCAVIKGEKYASEQDLFDLEFTEKRADIASYLISLIEKNEKIYAATLCDRLGEEYIDELNAVLLEGDGVNAASAAGYYVDCVKTVKRARLESEINDLNGCLSSLTDIDMMRKIVEQIQKKNDELNKLKH
ncbi:MAG TPA: DNA primase [Clostridiales bacterium]|nr:DNA primase [Clostridiales bacterium]